MASDAEVCANMLYSTKDFFVQTSLLVDPTGSTCNPYAAVYQTEAFSMYECNAMVADDAPVSGAQSFDSSCSVVGDQVSILYNYYMDTTCTELIESKPNPKISGLSQECNSVGSVGSIVWTNNYCVTDGSYTKYAASGELIEDLWYQGDSCTGNIILYSSLPLTTCFQENASNSSNWLKVGDNSYNQFTYDSVDCSGEGTPNFLENFPSSCAVADPQCLGSMSTFNDFNSVYFGPDSTSPSSDSNSNSSSDTNLGVGLGVGLGAALVIGAAAAYYRFYYVKKQNNALLNNALLNNAH